jgi:hypothetical protein
VEQRFVAIPIASSWHGNRAKAIADDVRGFAQMRAPQAGPMRPAVRRKQGPADDRGFTLVLMQASTHVPRIVGEQN